MGLSQKSVTGKVILFRQPVELLFFRLNDVFAKVRHGFYQIVYYLPFYLHSVRLLSLRFRRDFQDRFGKPYRFAEEIICFFRFAFFFVKTEPVFPFHNKGAAEHFFQSFSPFCKKLFRIAARIAEKEQDGRIAINTVFTDLLLCVVRKIRCEKVDIDIDVGIGLGLGLGLGLVLDLGLVRGRIFAFIYIMSEKPIQFDQVAYILNQNLLSFYRIEIE